MDDRYEIEKRRAAERSLEYIQDGMTIGLGTGSTAEYAVQLLGERVADGLRIKAVPTSERTRQLAEQCGIEITSLNDALRLDVTVDGADEVAPDLSLIKGGGGALLREKIIAYASETLVIVVDSRKMVANLGAFPLPIEVVPMAWKHWARALGAERREDEKGAPFITDEGNYILDRAMQSISAPCQVANDLDASPGIVEHGLFVDMADIVIVGRHDKETEVIFRPTSNRALGEA